MQSSFLQSNEWAEFQRSLGREVFEYPDLEAEPLSKEVQPPVITAKVIRHDLPFGKNYLYIPHGPAINFNAMTGGFKNPVTNFVKWLCEEAKKRKSIFIKAEPLVDSVAQVLADPPAGEFRKSKKEIQPSKTVVIDLEQNENVSNTTLLDKVVLDTLLGRMHHKTRYNIGVADKHGVVVVESDNVDVFLKLLKKTAKRDGFSLHAPDYYKKLFNFPELPTKLYLAKHSTRPVAAALVLICGNTGYYLHGASDYNFRSLMAPYALHWHIIKQLKAEKLKHYDMWGIEPRKWPGVTRFKLGWGGQTIERPGSFDLTVSKFWHFIYRSISSL